MAHLCQVFAALLFFTLIIFVVSDEEPAETGLRFRFTDKGIRNALDLGEKLLNEKLKSSKLPAIRILIDAGPGKGQATVRKLTISDFKPPTYKYQPLPPTGLQWSAGEGSITIKGIWAAWYKLWFKVSVDGFFLATVKNLSISAALDIKRGVDGRPEISVPNCRVSVDAIRLKITGGTLPKVMNIFRGALEEAIENALRKQVCKQVQNVLVEKANAKIRSLPPKIPLRGGPFLLDYTLASDPRVTDKFVEAAIKGAITYQGETSNITAPPMPETMEHKRMLYIWLSDYVPQTLLTSLHDKNIIQHQVNKDSTPHLAKYLRTTCPGSTCIGVFKDELAELYPNNYVALNIQSAEAPLIVFDHEDKKAKIAVRLKMDMFVEPRTDPDNLVMTFLAEMNATILPFFEGNNLSGNSTVDHVDMHVSFTKVGNISSFEIYLISDYIKPAIKKQIDQRLSPGFHIPTYENIELLHPKVTVIDRALKIETDFEYYVPKSEEVVEEEESNNTT